jgi:hypothetical protein
MPLLHNREEFLDPIARTNWMLDNKPYTKEAERSWIFRTLGYGHD